MNHPSYLSCCTIAALLACAASASAQSLLSQGEVLMAQGDPIVAVPGAINSGSSAISNPLIDQAGNVLFRGRMTGGGVGPTTDFGYFFGRTGGSLQMIARSGMADPTVGNLLGLGTVLNTATGTGLGGSPRLSPNGGILMFGCSMTGPTIITTGTAATGNNSTALLWGPVGSYLVLARRGMSFTTASNSQTYQIDTALNNPGYQGTALNGSGVACFQATVIGGDVSGTTNNVGWLTGTPGSLDWAARKGDVIVVAGGATPGSFPIGFLGFNCAMNSIGQVLHDERFSNTLGTPVATTANDNVVMIYTPGSGNQVIVREGDASPIAGANLGSPTISQGFGPLGRFGFGCTMTGAVTTADDTALFLADASSVQLVHREGTQATGLPAGVLMGTGNFSNSYSDYQGGSIAFYCVLTGAGVTLFNDTSLWLGRPGNVQLIAREGEPAPGFEYLPGFVSATFGDTNTGSSGIVAGSAQLNGRGMIVFSQVTVTVVDGTGTNVRGCTYCWDPTTGLKLFASAIDVYPTVAGPTVSFTAGGLQSPGGDDSPLDLNNHGDIVHAAFFTTGGAAVRTRIGSLFATPSAISTAIGGTQTMTLDAGVANAGYLYLVAGTFAGTTPGILLGSEIVPLNFPLYTNSIGLLDAQGNSTASLVLPGGLGAFAGATIHHAFGVIDPSANITHVSRACGVLLY